MDKIRLSFECYVQEEEKLWFPAFDHNGLYRVNMTNEQSVFMGAFPNEKKYAYRLYSSMVKRKDKIFFVPFYAEEIAVYNVEKESFLKIQLKPADSFGEKARGSELCKFWSRAVYENKLYMFPHNYPAIVIMDMDTLEIEYISEFVDRLERISVNGEPYITDLCQEENHVYCSCGCANAFLEMDLKNKGIIIHDLMTEANGFNGILKDDGKVWMAPRVDGDIVCYDMEKKEVRAYGGYPEKFEAPTVPFHSIYKYKEGFLLVPALGNQFIYFDKKKEKMENVAYLSSLIEKEKEKGVYSLDKTMAYSVDEGKLIFMNGSDYKLYVVDLAHRELDSKVYWIESDYPQSKFLFLGQFVCNPEMVLALGESEEFNICDYLNLISIDDKKCDRSVNTDKVKRSKGREIYEQIVKDI